MVGSWHPACLHGLLHLGPDRCDGLPAAIAVQPAVQPPPLPGVGGSPDPARWSWRAV